MASIFETLVAFFDADDWNYTTLNDLPVLSMSFTGRNGKWICYAQAREKQEQFVFYSVCPINAPEGRLGAVAEFITRANYGMIMGNFEMDYSDGEIRYKTSVDVEGAELLPALIRQVVYANVVIMDRYLPGLMSVIYGGAEPAATIRQIEENLPSHSDRDDLFPDVDNSSLN